MNRTLVEKQKSQESLQVIVSLETGVAAVCSKVGLAAL